MNFKELFFSLLQTTVKNILSYASDDTKRTFSSSISKDPTRVVTVETTHGPILFYCPGGLTSWRARTLLTKEPETIDWIDSIEPDEVLWDVGANVGCYSLYAAQKGVQVIAFEPAFTNYFLLNKNIHINNLNNNLKAYCIALTDSLKLGELHMPSMDMGGALNQFDALVNTESKNSEQSAFSQGMIGMSMDSLAAEGGLPFPNHLKIDVDGLEELILSGGLKTLKDPRLKSLSIEVPEDDTGHAIRITEMLQNCDLKVHSRKHSELMDQGPWSHVYNYVFIRA